MSTNKVHVDCYYKSLHKHHEELCGDKVEVRHNDEFYLMVLADGLGSGVKANILSTLTSTIISEMMIEGCSVEEVVETITATLPECKERKVAYSTFTILQVYYTGYARVVEFDNPSAIILRNHQEVKLEKTVKMYQQRNISEATFEVRPNDYIVFFSDGIIHAGLGTVLNLGWEHENVVEHLLAYYKEEDTANQVNDLLLCCVNDLYGGKCGDDSTVCVARIIPQTETRVMVGPPISPEDDEVVVDKLMKATGKKICCGGTTSNIVSRILNRVIDMDTLDSIVNDVPPIAKIQGLDLVSEGVLTLTKVNEHLKECVNDREYYENMMHSKQKDGASLMSKMLIKECTKIVFMVGRSDNPAHSQFAYSTISLSAKLRLIQSIQSSLHKLGKIVEIEHY